MVWGNNAFLAIYAQHDGPRTIRFPGPVTAADAYENRELAIGVTEMVLAMKRWETKLLTSK